jgi:Na+/H+ antiporter NhaD/arsenite permease-like protein
MDTQTNVWIAQGILVSLWIAYFFVEDKIHKLNRNLDDIKVTFGSCVVLFLLASALPTDVREEEHGIVHSVWEASQVLLTLSSLLLIVWMGNKIGAIELLKKLRTTSQMMNHYMYSAITFSSSAILDNVAATTVAIDVLENEEREKGKPHPTLFNAPSMANSGGAASPIGDSTTVYLWGKNMIGEGAILLFLIPSVLNALTCTMLTSLLVKSNTGATIKPAITRRNTLTFLGLLGALLLVPVLKVAFHMEVWQAAMSALCVMTLATRKVPDRKHLYEETKPALMMALIVLMMSQLSYSGLLGFIGENISGWHVLLVVLALGALSVLVDNMAVVAMAVHSMQKFYPVGHFFWYALAYSAGTSGSIHLPGSSAGVTLKKKLEHAFDNITITYFKTVGWINLVSWLVGLGAVALMYFYMRSVMVWSGITF